MPLFTILFCLVGIALCGLAFWFFAGPAVTVVVLAAAVVFTAVEWVRVRRARR